MDLHEKVLYSENLGEISGAQFHKALNKLGLGDFIRAERVKGGVGGQNVFLSSTQGDFVFRGNPYHREQLDAERFSVGYLRLHTNLSTAYPYKIDRDTDLFGYPYAIMPRLKGIAFDGSKERSTVTYDERLQICRAMADILAEIHNVIPEPNEIQHAPEPLRFTHANAASYAEDMISRLAETLRDLPDASDDDLLYVNNIIEKSKGALSAPFITCFVVGDFKEDNVLFSHDGGEWKVCAMFDFALSRFGDGEEDLPRLCAMYINESNDAALAREFIARYVKHRIPREGFSERLKLYILRERLELWSWAKSFG